jgi:hypothetical protein
MGKVGETAEVGEPPEGDGGDAHFVRRVAQESEVLARRRELWMCHDNGKRVFSVWEEQRVSEGWRESSSPNILW